MTEPEHVRAPRPKVTRILIAVTGILILVAAVGVPVYLANYGTDQQGQKEAAQAGQAAEHAEKKDLATQVAEACAAGGVVGKNLTQRGLCGKAKEIIQEPIQGKQGETGKQGPPPSDAQVQRAVDAYCANGRCNGKSPTPQQVASAVAAYCNARGQCTPPKPKDGKDGENATSAQVAAAVASYCANDACDGKDGTDGSNGTNGKDGRGVTISTEAVTGGTKVTVSYTDGTDPVSFTVLDGKDGAPSQVPGPEGPAGKNAYPFDFTFIIPANPPLTTAHTYNCHIENPSTPATCTEAESTP